MEGLAGSARRVAEEIERLGIDTRVVTMPESTRTAPEAAAAIGCDVAQIVKSLVFRDTAGDRPLLVLVSGADRVDESRLAEAVGRPVEKASGKFVRERTGYAIGGVPPIGHHDEVELFVDKGLLACPVVWAAAGTPNTVFSVPPGELADLPSARVVQVAGAGPD